MSRFLFAFAGLFCFLPVVSASFGAPQFPAARTVEKAEALRATAREAKRAMPASPECVMTEETEVKLNGRVCQFKDVPGHAIITNIEVDADTREILKIHFSTQK